MDRLGLLNTLITALDAGSLSRAAKRQGMTQSAVSQQIQQLEQLLGQQLLLRTASGVRATRAGATAAQHARGLLAGYAALEKDLDSQSDRLSGTYRISVGTVFGRTFMGPLLLQLRQKYPDLDIVMNTDDRIVDVVRENYDLAIRAGTIGNNEGFGRKIAEFETVLLASPEYVKTHGLPQHPDDLKRLSFIRYNEEAANNMLRLTRNRLGVDAEVRVGFTASDPQLMLQALTGGMGFARVVRMIAEEEIRSGALVELLPSYTPAPKQVYAVYPSRNGLDRCQEAIISGFLDLVKAQHPNTTTTSKPLELITA